MQQLIHAFFTFSTTKLFLASDLFSRPPNNYRQFVTWCCCRCIGATGTQCTTHCHKLLHLHLACTPPAPAPALYCACIAPAPARNAVQSNFGCGDKFLPHGSLSVSRYVFCLKVHWSNVVTKMVRCSVSVPIIFGQRAISLQIA